jgi:DNA-binding CsgD family transcriptional regulator
MKRPGLPPLLRVAGAAPPEGLRADRFTLAGEEFMVLSFVAIDGVAGALTAAEADIVQHIMMGRSNREIATYRRTSIRTVTNQVAGILRKLGARSRYDLVVMLERGKSRTSSGMLS